MTALSKTSKANPAKATYVPRPISEDRVRALIRGQLAEAGGWDTPNDAPSLSDLSTRKPSKLEPECSDVIRF